ncbi:acyl-CoA dehydrogenase family protein [Streptomyces sp. NPDC058739]|uniref:acyl-CoA dehydrogenase family protein n=1 Tax=Streptomyces sp. NPDC058739 TaxID=3346618 RepID=UPI0036B5CCF9
MSKADLVALVADLERYLGDPYEAGTRMSFARVLESDEREEYPNSFVNQLRRFGVHVYSLPAEQGGKAGNVETGFNLMRMVARRDPTTATAMVITNLSFMPVWTAGTDEQKRLLIEDFKHGGGLSWGLSERDHGSDLLANETTAEKVDGGYLLTGEKWLIGNATVAGKMAVFARTGKRPGPAAYSIFILDKHTAAPETIEELPVETLHGLRALDLSGIRLKGAFVPDEWRIGREGEGLEIALKSSQAMRAVISSLALGAVDTTLRVNLDFTENRVLFGDPVSDVPYTRRQLTEAFADLMVADAVSLGASRGLQAAPEQVSVVSSVAKYLLPTMLEKSMSELNTVLGARMFLRGQGHYSMHQKMLRDLLVTNFADGNTVVNLRNLGQQLDGLLAKAATADAGLRGAAAERVAVLFGMDAELPVYQPWKQELFSRGLDDAVLAAPDGLERLRSLAEDAKDAERDRLRRAAAVAEVLLERIAPLAERATRLKADLGRGYSQSPELFALAKEYCLVHAAAACVHTYVHSHDVLEDPLPSAAVLLLQLERLRRQLWPAELVTDQDDIDEVMRVLRHLYRDNRMFSHWQFPLGERAF